VRLLKAAGVPTVVVIGADAEDASRRARGVLARLEVPESRPAGIVAVGGDGMVHLALNVALEHDLPLGIVPAGTGNDFARVVGFAASSASAAVELVLDALWAPSLPRVDVGQIVGGAAFGCVLSAGFDACVNARANRISHVPGRARYPVAMLAELPRFKPLECVINIDGVEYHHRAMLIAIGNGSSYGGGMRICPSASVSDGMLDVTVVDEIGVGELLRLFPRVYSGRHMEHPQTHGYRAHVVTATFSGGLVPTVFADGEPMSAGQWSGSLTALARPGALRLLTTTLP
jgi:diacylglycerol kinase (ATP)